MTQQSETPLAQKLLIVWLALVVPVAAALIGLLDALVF